MAISYINKLFENMTPAKTVTVALGFSCKAGSTLIMAVCGEAGSSLTVNSVTDSAGNTWEIEQQSNSGTLVALAWTRTAVALTTSDTVTVGLNQTPGNIWRSCHNFEGASVTADDIQTSWATSTDAFVTVNVTGSDWLAVGAVIFPSDTSLTTTEVDSSLSRDTRDTPAYCEIWSRNGTVAGTTRIGATISSAKTRRVIGVSFPAQALNTAKKYPNFLIGV